MTKVVMIYPRASDEMRGAIPEEFDHVLELRDPLQMTGLRKILPHLDVGTGAFVKVFDDQRKDMMRWADEFQEKYKAYHMQVVEVDPEGKAVYLYFQNGDAERLKADLAKRRDSHYIRLLEQELSKTFVE